MWQTILWQIVLFLLPYVLKIAKEWMQKILKHVAEAETTNLTGTEKRALVMKQIKEEMEFAKTSIPIWIINTIIEIGVSYLKTK